MGLKEKIAAITTATLVEFDYTTMASTGDVFLEPKMVTGQGILFENQFEKWRFLFLPGDANNLPGHLFKIESRDASGVPTCTNPPCGFPIPESPLRPIKEVDSPKNISIPELFTWQELLRNRFYDCLRLMK
ncbi:MAG: hypothetical protein AAB590_01220 [Patescibacteria group bacterium]